VTDEQQGPLSALLLVLTGVTGLVDAVSYLRLGHVMEQGKEQSDIARWIPVVVPLSGLAIVLVVYLVAAEVLTRVS
jgi:hypothetical protein